MIKHKRDFVLAGVLLALFISSVAIDFLHTEKTFQPDPNCPACQFHKSSLTATSVYFFDLSGLEFLAFIEPVRISAAIESSRVIYSSRAPPQA